MIGQTKKQNKNKLKILVLKVLLPKNIQVSPQDCTITIKQL